MSLDAEFLSIPVSALDHLRDLPQGRRSLEMNGLLAQCNSFKAEFDYSGRVALSLEKFLESERAICFRQQASPAWSDLLSDRGDHDSIVISHRETHLLRVRLAEAHVSRDAIERFGRRAGYTDESGQVGFSEDFVSAMLATIPYVEDWLSSIKDGMVGIRSFYY